VSLINEALRKARSEVTAREGRARRLPTALAGGPRRPRSGAGLVAVTLVAGAAALGGAAAAWWAFGRDSKAPARPTTAVAGEPAAPGPLPTAAPAPAVAGWQPTGALPDAPVRGGPALDGAPPAPIAEGPPAKPTAASAAVTADPAPVDISTPAPPPHAAPERSYVLTAELGYARLHLDYIVYKPSAPFGRVNGQDIIVGSVVDGFVVEEIGESHVRLHDARGPVVLRVR
jgi:hypothetical protein